MWTPENEHELNQWLAVGGWVMKARREIVKGYYVKAQKTLAYVLEIAETERERLKALHEKQKEVRVSETDVWRG